MSSENSTSSNVSGATSPAGLPNPTTPDDAAKHLPGEVTEADYLTRQQDQAKAAIGAVIGDMKTAAITALDVKEWTRQHPWILSGIAAAAGFAAGMLLTPKKDESLKEFWEEKWESIKDKLTPDPASPEAKPRSPFAREEPKQSAIGAILSQSLKVIGPSLGAMLSGMMAANQEPDQANGHAGNGHSDSTPPPT